MSEKTLIAGCLEPKSHGIVFRRWGYVFPITEKELKDCGWVKADIASIAEWMRSQKIAFIDSGKQEKGEYLIKHSDGSESKSQSEGLAFPAQKTEKSTRDENGERSEDEVKKG